MASVQGEAQGELRLGQPAVQLMPEPPIGDALATEESELDEAQRAQLEDADSVFLRYTPMLYESVIALGDLADLRRRAATPCSHWWWYLEKLAQRESIKV
jgi:hypothetical protein